MHRLIRSGVRANFSLLLIAATLIFGPVSLAQTQISAPSNRYSVNDDIRLGQDAANQVRRQKQLISDRDVQEYLESVGRRLVDAIPPQFQHREFHYSFQVVNDRTINAFALPGGPTFVNRGMIEAAKNEGELAGVMAHELSHVALRHATAQATETQKYQVGSVLGQIAGAVIGGGLGEVVGQGSQAGFGLTALKYSRKYETQADILGAQIMARAGYDPHDLANVFRTIQAQSGSGGPQFLSDHPNPGNRFERINQEAAMLKVTPNPETKDNTAFLEARSRLSRTRTDTYASNGRNRNGDPNSTYPNTNSGSTSYPRTERVAYPSSTYRTYSQNNQYRVRIPDNWRETSSSESLTYAPDGAYGTMQGQPVLTHGVIMGSSATNQGDDLRSATDAFVNGLLDTNTYLRRDSGFQRSAIGASTAMKAQLSGMSAVTHKSEIVTVYTTQMRDGNLFYLISVVPQDEVSTYQPTFDSILHSVQFTN